MSHMILVNTALKNQLELQPCAMFIHNIGYYIYGDNLVLISIMDFILSMPIAQMAPLFPLRTRWRVIS